ncbi:aminoglycoside phosphotransferase family protein [Kitasatospora sp. NPDC096147]|uniref:aminoglycoside phosphotransferase family protein n=1 Tax=Kitasatospora sp. NPDC096147 TaxID=3364093 RepID=UPI0038301C7F
MWSRVPFGDELRAELGVPREAKRLTSSPRSRVWRVELGGRPAVVKQAVEGADAEERYARELAGLRIAGRAGVGGVPVVPAVLGVDPAARVLVLEHLEHQRPSGDWIVAYARALARMHATAGPQDAGALPRWRGPDRADVDSFLALAETLGVSAPATLAEALGALVDRLAAAPGHALLHGDPCPGNDLHTPDGVRFIDFEQASLGSGLVELAYLRIGFPTCWCVTAAPDPLLHRAEAAYRDTWHELTGHALGQDLTDACTGWLLRGGALVPRAERDGTDHLARLPAEDWTWGTTTARRRLVHRLGVVGQLAASRSDLGELAALCAAFWEAALTRWPRLPPVLAERP